MNTVDTALDEQLDAILDDMNWGYQFQMSDYATSRAQEKEYEAAGLEEIATAKREIKALISSLTNEAELRGRVDELRRICLAKPGMFNKVGRFIRGGEDHKTMWWNLMGEVMELGKYRSDRLAALLKLSSASSRINPSVRTDTHNGTEPSA